MAMTPEQFVEAIGTGNIIHNSGDLFGDHLRSVQRVLKEWGEDEELQLAGLFHSIYGTEGFQDFQLSFDRRDDIKRLIGEVIRLACTCSCCCPLPKLGSTLECNRPNITSPMHYRLRVNHSHLCSEQSSVHSATVSWTAQPWTRHCQTATTPTASARALMWLEGHISL